MRPLEPYDQPLQVSAVEQELVFIGQGRTAFSMTREAARWSLHNLAAALLAVPIAERHLAHGVILVVEDEPLISEVAAIILEDAGYEVILAGHAAAAINALETGAQVHLLFTDIQLPGGIDGLHLAQIVRERWPLIPVLVTSGQGSVPLDNLPAGGKFLAKPYVAGAVLKFVEELIAA